MMREEKVLRSKVDGSKSAVVGGGDEIGSLDFGINFEERNCERIR